MAGAGVRVSVEALQEHQIQEVRLDGQEIYVQQLSMSEKLSKLAHKIDFFKDESEGKGKAASEGEKEVVEEKQLAPFMPSLWPWDSIRNHLKCSMTEMSVLLDVLNLVKEKHYLVADPVSQDSPDNRPAAQIIAKKKSLTAAAAVLVGGAERLKRSISEANKKGASDFHTELSNLHKKWRLKKVSSTIVGDLSYRSVGSRFWQGGSFEVRKTVDTESAEPEGDGGRRSSLEVTVPSELEGVAYIQVEVKTVPDMMELTSCALNMPPGLTSVPTNANWQPKLESAQNVLFCKELFAQLAREAVQVRSATPHMVIGNQIITNVFPGHQLSIVLCHYTGKEKKIPVTRNKLEHNHVLEHSLHQLLHELHHRHATIHPPHPVNATYGMTKRRRLAGPLAMTRQQLVQMSEHEPMLCEIIQQTKHAVLRIRSMHVIDQMAVSVQDPQISAHWGCLNSPLQSSVRILITSAGYENINESTNDTLSRTSLVLLIGVDSIHVVMKDGRTCLLSFEDKELQDLLQWQIAQHHTLVVQQIARYQGWQVLSANSSIGSGDCDSFATASAITIASPKGDKVISFRSGPSSGQHLAIKTLDPEAQSHPSPAVTDPIFFQHGTGFKEVNLEKLEGRNLASKIDMLMAHLSCQ